MDWYSRLKTSALESEWWVRFYEHLSKTAQFLLSGNGMQLQNGFSSGVDGNHLFFSFKVSYKNHNYSCNVHLEFAHRLSDNMKWQQSNLMSLQESGDSFVKARWFVIAESVTDRSDYHIAGQGYLLPPNALPNSIMQSIKQSILSDGEDDDGSVEQEPTPDPSQGLELEVPQYV